MRIANESPTFETVWTAAGNVFLGKKKAREEKMSKIILTILLRYVRPKPSGDWDWYAFIKFAFLILFFPEEYIPYDLNVRVNRGEFVTKRARYKLASMSIFVF